MRNRLLIFILLFVVQLSEAQNRFEVLDSVTNKPISYVNIWFNKTALGTSSNEKGEFYLKANSEENDVIFSAVGYKRKIISYKKLENKIFLTPQITELAEVVIKSKRKEKHLTIGKFKRGRINSYFGNSDNPWILARYFPYSDNYEKTPFIKKIQLATSCFNDSALLNIRLYKVDEEGKPGDFLFNKNIIVVARKYFKCDLIDLSNFDIKIPKEGFFMAVEGLVLELNKRESETPTIKKGQKVSHIYEPAIGTIKAQNSEESWVYYQGSWIKYSQWVKVKKFKSSYMQNHLLAVEITLSN